MSQAANHGVRGASSLLSMAALEAPGPCHRCTQRGQRARCARARRRGPHRSQRSRRAHLALEIGFHRNRQVKRREIGTVTPDT